MFEDGTRCDEFQSHFQLDQQSFELNKRKLCRGRAIDLAVDAVKVADLVRVEIHANGETSTPSRDNRIDEPLFIESAIMELKQPPRSLVIL